MKGSVKLTVILILVCHSLNYAQVNSKKLSLKLTDLKTIEKNDPKFSWWTLKVVLTNHSLDTIFNFIIPDCEAAYCILEGATDLAVYFDQCDTSKMTVVKIPPSGHRSFNLEIVSASANAGTNAGSSVSKFKVLLLLLKANNASERLPYKSLMSKKERKMYIASNRIKIKRRGAKKVKSGSPK